jgi:hypothetical protein
MTATYDKILLESGDFLLLESGDKLLTGTVTVALTGVRSVSKTVSYPGTVSANNDIILYGVRSVSKTVASSGTVEIGTVLTGVQSVSKTVSNPGIVKAGVALTGVQSLSKTTARPGSAVYGGVILTGVQSISKTVATPGTAVYGGVILTGVQSISKTIAYPGVLDTTSADVILFGVRSVSSTVSRPGIVTVTFSPDYSVVLEVVPTRIMTRKRTRNNFEYEFEDGQTRVVNLSDVKEEIELQWDYISETDRETILDWYHNSSKANGIKNTFWWEDPRSNEIEVVRFSGPLKTVFQPGFLQSIDKIKLKIIN